MAESSIMSDEEVDELEPWDWIEVKCPRCGMRTEVPAHTVSEAKRWRCLNGHESEVMERVDGAEEAK